MELLKNRPDIVNVLKSVAIEQGLGHYRITDITTNDKGQGYMGQVFMVTIKDSTKNKRLDLVIKSAFAEPAIRALGPIEAAYKNESYFYCSVYPAFQKFERSKGILESVELLPKCYRVSLKDREEMLCLENLRARGFEMYDRKLTLDHEHLSLIFKNYGRLHAYSFALQDQQPKEYAKLTKGLHKVLATLFNDEGYKGNMKGMMSLVINYLTPGKDDQIIKKCEKYTTNELDDIFRGISTKPEDFSVIMHGDCWSSNMMFKYEVSESGKKLSEMRLLDLQVADEGSPVHDLSYCLYSGGSKELYDNLDDYLRIYYDSFSSFLKQLGSDPEKLFPFDALKDHWKKYSKFGISMGIVIQRMKLTDAADVVEVTDGFESAAEIGQAVINTKFDEATFKDRLRDLLHHVSEIDAL